MLAFVPDPADSSARGKVCERAGYCVQARSG